MKPLSTNRLSRRQQATGYKLRTIVQGQALGSSDMLFVAPGVANFATNNGVQALRGAMEQLRPLAAGR